MIVQFNIYNDGDYWCARGVGVDIYTQAKTMEELTIRIKDAVKLHFAEVVEAGREITVVSVT